MMRDSTLDVLSRCLFRFESGELAIPGQEECPIVLLASIFFTWRYEVNFVLNRKFSAYLRE